MELLNKDVIIHLFDFLSPSDFVALLKTSKTFASVAKKQEEMIYRNFFKRDFVKYMQPYSREHLDKWCQKYSDKMKHEYSRRLEGVETRFSEITSRATPKDVMEQLRNLEHTCCIPWKEVYTRFYMTCRNIKCYEGACLSSATKLLIWYEKQISNICDKTKSISKTAK